MVGIVQFMMHITFVYANKLTSVGNAIVLQYSSMIFVLLYESIEKRKLPMKYQWIVILLAFSGMFVFFMDSFSMNGILGNILAIISGAFFGLQFFLNTKKSADPFSSISIQYIISICVMIIYIFINRDVQLSARDLVYLGGNGIFQTALPGLFFSKCITLIPAFTANVICMSEVIFSPLWAFLFLQEFFTPFALLGSLIIIISLFINMYYEYKLKLPK
jgi:drug/metabolite transporter (DMT)-like permease